MLVAWLASSSGSWGCKPKAVCEVPVQMSGGRGRGRQAGDWGRCALSIRKSFPGTRNLGEKSTSKREEHIFFFKASWHIPFNQIALWSYYNLRTVDSFRTLGTSHWTCSCAVLSETCKGVYWWANRMDLHGSSSLLSNPSSSNFSYCTDLKHLWHQYRPVNFLSDFSPVSGCSIEKAHSGWILCQMVYEAYSWTRTRALSVIWIIPVQMSSSIKLSRNQTFQCEEFFLLDFFKCYC